MMNKRHWLIRQLLLWTIVLPHIVLAASTQIVTIRFVKLDSATRMVIALNQSAPAKIFLLNHPERLVVDFPKVKLTAQLKKIDFHSPAIKALRVGYPDAATVRLVLDMTMPMHYTIASRPEDPALIIDLIKGPEERRKKMVITPNVAALQQNTTAGKKSAALPVEKTPTPSRKFVVVIDPGHGGKDPGAIGEGGTREKNVVLAISKALAERINREPTMHAVMTRTGDYFVPLRGRLHFARKGNGDLFVAIHADSYFNNQAKGVSIYALSQHGATTEAARWLAKRDNYSELGGVNLRGLGDQSYLLRSVLIDLAQTATITDSLRLGTTILHTMRNVTDLHYPHVEQAPFVVLKSPDIPSILVETGFISNREEEDRLGDSRYQQQIAQALFVGIQNYFKNYSAMGV